MGRNAGMGRQPDWHVKNRIHNNQYSSWRIRCKQKNEISHILFFAYSAFVFFDNTLFVAIFTVVSVSGMCLPFYFE